MTSSVTRGIPMVRALFRAIAISGTAPQSVLSAKVYYPALYGATPAENNTGALPVAPAKQPYPVAIVMPGINVGPESYGWLAKALVEAGFVTVLYGWIVEEAPGFVALSPGLDVSALSPADYGKRPSASALAAVLADLAMQNASGPLAGRLDLSKILLGGHSAGGSVALFNGRADWFPGLRAVFTYGSHSKASTQLGYPPETVLKLPDELPKLVLGGSEDGVIAASAFRYGGAGGKPDPTGALRRTFAEGMASERGDCYLAIVAGANHFSLAWPADTTTGRPFLDWPVARPENEIRSDLEKLIVLFARAHVAGDTVARVELRKALSDRARVQHSAIR